MPFPPRDWRQGSSFRSCLPPWPSGPCSSWPPCIRNSAVARLHGEEISTMVSSWYTAQLHHSICWFLHPFLYQDTVRMLPQLVRDAPPGRCKICGAEVHHCNLLLSCGSSASHHCLEKEKLPVGFLIASTCSWFAHHATLPTSGGASAETEAYFILGLHCGITLNSYSATLLRLSTMAE